MSRGPFLLLAAAVLLAQPANELADISADAGGDIHIKFTMGRKVVPPRQKDQSGVSKPSVSEDKKAAGWLVEFITCCQNYGVPTQLAIYRPGKPLTLFDGEPMIGDWLFVEGSRKVALCEVSAHGDPHPAYELYDIATRRQLEHWSGELTDKAPAWTHFLSCE